MEQGKHKCLWCGRLGEEDKMINCGSSLLEGFEPLRYHEDCYDEAKDNQ